MKISFSPSNLPASGAVALFVDGKGVMGTMAKNADQKSGGTLHRAMECANFSGAEATVLEIPGCSDLGSGLVFLVGLGNDEKLSSTSLEKIGGSLIAKTENKNLSQLNVVVDETDRFPDGMAAAAAYMALGVQLRAYRFRKYKTTVGTQIKNRGRNKENTDSPSTPGRVSFLLGNDSKVRAARRAWQPLKLLSEAVDMTRDLVNEPANVLYPKSFAGRAKELTKLGVKVEVLGESRMKALGMNAMLQVGRGSEQESQLVVMQWNGVPKSRQKNPVAIVGKGVCFDSGGISLKPAAKMEDMRGDMAGAACVAGLMRLLATRKAAVNVVGVIGLVENMINGEAQRPGDIVTSMSGQTIEVLNTDAEGRLLLSDAIYFVRKRFSPQTIIDLATLTGAILVSLGQDRAGLFSNDDVLAEELFQAGEKEGEPLWRMPMGTCYDKMIDSPVADMKNIGGRFAGSIVAAQFLARFVGDVSWAHLDIAGTAMGSPSSPTNVSWASGFGVRLLNRFLADRYER